MVRDSRFRHGQSQGYSRSTLSKLKTVAMGEKQRSDTDKAEKGQAC
jgi:hypothetical protein